ncbi:MAG: hypothetical protein H0X41_02085 [Chitinophagaceae bacterium]|nr:hypothetical protein [Chitinophagaceae bacterium]
MKKIYALTVVCLAFALAGSATQYYWIGVDGASWSVGSSWSATSGGPAGSGWPSAVTDDAVFDNNANVIFTTNTNIGTLSIASGKAVVITVSNPAKIKLIINGTNPAAPGLFIAPSAVLTCNATDNEFIISFAPGSQGSVDGEWVFSGSAYFEFAGTIDAGTRLNINGTGKMTASPSGFIGDSGAFGESYLVFKSGSVLEFQSDGAIVPHGNYDAGSTIVITGCQFVGVIIDETNAIGNLTFDCPSLATDADLGLYNLNIQGNLLIKNTNGNVLNLIGQRTLQNATDVNVGINGDFIISGNSFVNELTLFDGKTTNLTVQGDFKAGGQSFNMQADNDASLPTNLIVKKSFTVSSGIFYASSNAVSESQNLFNVELNGSIVQDLATTTALDNANNQITLRVNNALGINMNSDVSVGRVVFVSPNKGIIHTGAHVLTVNNTSATNAVTGYGGNAFVEGTVTRRTNSANAIIFPTGLSNTFRKFTITPIDGAPNTFQVTLNSGNNGGAYISPVATLANYYWNVTRTGSSSATVAMDLVGSIGASATDTLISARYSGTNWLDARGATGNYIYSGNSTSGTLTTAIQSAFQAFTIASATNSILPIKLLSFTGKKIQNTAALAWEITENSTPARFEVVRSTDGAIFTSVGFLSGIEGKLNYTLTDNSLSAGNNFYRLKMYDRDGSITYSSIIVVMNGSKGILISSMIPTVVRDRAKLNISSSIKGNMQMVITDISGRIVQNQIVAINSGNQEVWLNASSLSAGMFQITGYINGEKTATFRFIKQ